MNQFPGRVLAVRDGGIQCGAHRILVPPHALAGLKEGDAATVLVRPETVVIAPGGANPNVAAAVGRNELVANVEGVTFLGSVRRVALDATRQKIVADVPATAPGQVTRGDRVLISFAIEACRVIACADADGSSGKPMEGGPG
jgi:ABC-type Fe3+/spermidine/putrescine transport system ATPase subunit